MLKLSNEVDVRQSMRENILKLLHQRGVEKTCCPIEIPRSLFGNEWRNYMDMTRSVSWDLCDEGLIEVCQKGVAVTDKLDVKGPIRLRLKTIKN